MAQPAKRVAPKGPELGSFPLDHFRECKQEIETYYRCLEANGRMTPMCRPEIRDYLECRMDRGLMTKVDVGVFGIPDTEFVPTKMHKADTQRDATRAGGTATIVGAAWEGKFKNEELQKDDGYERDRSTGDIVMPEKEGLPVPSRIRGDTI